MMSGSGQDFRQVVETGGNYNNGPAAGAFALNCNNNWNNGNVNNGVRLSWETPRQRNRPLLQLSRSCTAEAVSKTCGRFKAAGNRNIEAGLVARSKRPSFHDGEVDSENFFHPMPKRAKNLWERFVSDENINLAITQACRGKGKRADVRNLLNCRAMVIADIQNELEAGKWETDPPRPFTLTEGLSRKTRTIYPPTIKDMVKQWMLMQVIEPVIYRGLIAHSCCNIVGRGTGYAKEYLESRIRENAKKEYAVRAGGKKYNNPMRWYLQGDFKSFFESIPIAKLEAKLRRLIKDERILGFIHAQFAWREVGVVLGRYDSQHLANFYLSDFDHYVKESLGGGVYVRYMDDFVLFGTSRSVLQKQLVAMREWAAENGLIIGKAKIKKFCEECEVCGDHVNVSDLAAKRKIRVRFHSVTPTWQRGLFDVFVAGLGVVHQCTKAQTSIVYVKERISKAEFVRRAEEAGLSFVGCSVSVVDTSRVDFCGFLFREKNTQIRKRIRLNVIKACRALRRGQYTEKNCRSFWSYWGWIAATDSRKFREKYTRGIDFYRARNVVREADKKRNRRKK